MDDLKREFKFQWFEETAGSIFDLLKEDDVERNELFPDGISDEELQDYASTDALIQWENDVDYFNEEFHDYTGDFKVFRTKCAWSGKKEPAVPVGSINIEKPIHILEGFNSFTEGYETEVEETSEGLQVRLNHPGGRESFLFQRV